jgi:hypothetical protein
MWDRTLDGSSRVSLPFNLVAIKDIVLDIPFL